jgi:hypothetical protein
LGGSFVVKTMMKYASWLIFWPVGVMVSSGSHRRASSWIDGTIKETRGRTIDRGKSRARTGDR